ncbi:hypothetical protein K1720_10040 [Thermococcus argininiproducens]|uniref:Uncharacterized protein n=1 Tax=Thermococcus argininiproducens TaxID=2866384 RepID=A0A9E7SCU3_9EURY|nr:hypothetical protein [Thermococcus argininiproducens]USG99816.1 hypothetical protein K1720_10040 [Thermococcus argininiproducens]
MKNRKVWYISFMIMIFFVLLAIYFIKLRSPYGAVIAVTLSMIAMYTGMELAGIEKSIKELRITSATLEAYIFLALLWFAWKAGTLYGTQQFKEFVTTSRNIITLAISIHLGIRVYYWLKGETK